MLTAAALGTRARGHGIATRAISVSGPGQRIRPNRKVIIMALQRVCSILLLAAVTVPSDTSSPATDPKHLDSLQEELIGYLRGRVLIFRMEGTGYLEMRFNSQGHLIESQKPFTTSEPVAIAFVRPTLSDERLLIQGEVLRWGPLDSSVRFERDPRFLRLLSCTILLDRPVAELTRSYLVLLLSRVFLTQDEFRKWVGKPEQRPEGSGTSTGGAGDP